MLQITEDVVGSEYLCGWEREVCDVRHSVGNGDEAML